MRRSQYSDMEEIRRQRAVAEESIERVLSRDAEDRKSVISTVLNALANLGYHMGYMTGYDDGMDDCKRGRDRRTGNVHLN